MSEQPPLIDNRRPEMPPPQAGNRAAKILLFVLGVIAGPLALTGMLFASNGNRDAIIAILIAYVLCVVLLLYFDGTRAVGIGLICGPPLALLIVFIICASTVRF